MSDWTLHADYADVWQVYAHLPIQTMTAAEVMATVSPGSGSTWPDELNMLWTADRYDTLVLLADATQRGILEPIIIGPDGRLWDGHHRLAAALALGITVPARIVPSA